MSAALGIALGAAALVAWLLLARRPSVTREVSRAVSTRDIAPLVTLLSAKPEDTRPTAFNAAVKGLWDRYERGLAARLMRDMASLVAGASIAQYWLKQAIEVEPDIARETFSDEFLSEFYNPEVAARCGKFG